jgi:putative ABC transporter-associated repeat protein
MAETGSGGVSPSDGVGGFGLDVRVPNHSLTGSGALIVNTGHVDVASQVEEGRLATRIKDTSESGPSVYHGTDQVVLQLLPESATEVPASDQFAFLGDPGAPVWQVTQNQQDGLIWPGWSTEEVPAGATVGGVGWALTAKDGPGEFALYRSGSFGEPQVLFNTRDGIDAADAFTIPKNTHAHGAWAFGAEGVYCLGFTRTATMADGSESADSFNLAFAVGDTDVRAVDPGRCVTSGNQPDNPSTDDPPTDEDSDGGEDAADPTGGDGGEDRDGQGNADAPDCEGDGGSDPHASRNDVTGDEGDADRPGADGDSPGQPGDEVPGRDGQGNTDPPGGEGDGCMPGDSGGGGEESDHGGGAAPPAGHDDVPGDQGDADQPSDGGDSPGQPDDDPGRDEQGNADPSGNEGGGQPGDGTGQPNEAGDGGQPSGPDQGSDDQDPDDPSAADPPGTPPAIWDVPNGTVNAKGATVLNDGHVDIASVLEGASLGTRIKDTTRSGEPVWRDPATTILQLLPGTQATVPESPAFRFLGAAGATVYQVAQTQQPGLLWPGWSTEAIPIAATTGGVAWALTGVTGPGEFALYQTADFGTPTVLFNTRDGITAADRFTIPKNTHAHGSWAFSEPGAYCLAFARAVVLGDGTAASDNFNLAVAVGWTDVMDLAPAACPKDAAEVPAQDGPDAEDAAGANAGDPHDSANTTTTGAGKATTNAAQTAQSTSAAKCAPAKAVLSSGHVDYASRLVGGRLQSLIGDETAGAKVYREPGSVVLWLKSSSGVTIPPGYGQVGAVGSKVWQIPQTQNPDLVWLGWNTEGLNAGNARGAVTWEITSVSGPGAVRVYLSNAFGGIQEVVFAGTGSYDVPLGVHAHANWAFSAQGVYRITSTQTVTLADGSRSADTETLTIAVGNTDLAALTAPVCGAAATQAARRGGVVVPDAVIDAAWLSARQAAAPDTGVAALSPEGSGVDASISNEGRPSDQARGEAGSVTAPVASASSVPSLLTILGGLALLGAAGIAMVLRRRVRQDWPQ